MCRNVDCYLYEWLNHDVLTCLLVSFEFDLTVRPKKYSILILHAEKRSVKFTGNSVLIWITWLFSKFYKKLSSINRFSVQFT